MLSAAGSRTSRYSYRGRYAWAKMPTRITASSAHHHASFFVICPRSTFAVRRSSLVSEMPPAGEHHRHPALVGGGDHLGVVLRSTGLDDGGRAGRRGGVEA